MAKDILKKEARVQAPEIQEAPPTTQREQGVGVIVEAPRESTTETEVAAQEATSVVGEKLQEDRVAPTRTAPAVVQQTDRLEEEIEDILEEDLKELYLAMPPQAQAEFRAKGEQTRSKIRELVRAARVNAKKIFQLIRDWLKMIPGVNRFFLEQEAKIKTDKILLVSEEEKKRSENL